MSGINYDCTTSCLLHLLFDFAPVMKTKGWIPWTLHLSYDRMLRGIPGTGTRNGGMSGQLLAVNLDAIILFKFHGEKSFICHIFSFTLVDIKAQK